MVDCVSGGVIPILLSKWHVQAAASTRHRFEPTQAKHGCTNASDSGKDVPIAPAPQCAPPALRPLCPLHRVRERDCVSRRRQRPDALGPTRQVARQLLRLQMRPMPIRPRRKAEETENPPEPGQLLRAAAALPTVPTA